MTERERWLFYRSAAWLKFREVILARDKHLCQPCLRQQRFAGANTVHHKIPLEERPDLALVPENVESVCPACHNLLHPGKGYGHKDLRKRVVAILGYPGAGKTSYVRMMMNEYDIVLDLDLLVAAMTFRPVHDRAGAAFHAVRIADDIITRVIRDVRAKGYAFDTLWIIRTRLSDEELACLRAARAKLYWLCADRETCRRRLAEQGREALCEVFDKCDDFLRVHGSRLMKIGGIPPTL